MARLWLHLARWVGAGAPDRTDNPPTLANERNHSILLQVFYSCCVTWVTNVQKKTGTLKRVKSRRMRLATYLPT